MTLAITSLALGIPFSAIAVAVGSKHWAGALTALTVVWTAIAIINIACTVGHPARLRHPQDHR